MRARHLLTAAPLLCACALTVAAAADGGSQNPPQAFAQAFSRNLQIISDADARRLEQFGRYGLTESLVKPVQGMTPQKYQTFDESLVVAVNAGGRIAPAVLDFIRGLVREQVKQANFTVAAPDRAQAGIASILSTFHGADGAVTTELLLVVFDREKMRAVQRGNPQLPLLDAVFQAAIRAIVSHLYPATELNLLLDAVDDRTRDGLKILFERGFSHFMEPTALELGRPS